MQKVLFKLFFIVFVGLSLQSCEFLESLIGKKAEKTNNKDNSENSTPKISINDNKTRIARVAGFPKNAIIISNESYSNIGPVIGSIGDGKMLNTIFTEKGFNSKFFENLKKRELVLNIANFVRSIEDNSVNIFYFSGYALSYNGKNYLLSVDQKLSQKSDIAGSGLDLEDILKDLRATAAKANIIILNASRKTPYDEGISGLVSSSGNQKNLVIFSNQAGQTNNFVDNLRNSLFAKQIAKVFSNGGISINEMPLTVQRLVLTFSENKQKPWYSTNFKVNYEIPLGVNIEKDKDIEIYTEDQPSEISFLQDIDSDMYLSSIAKAAKADYTAVSGYSVVYSEQTNTITQDMVGILNDPLLDISWDDSAMSESEIIGYLKSRNVGKTGDFDYAKKFCENSTLASRTTWRLPKIQELKATVDKNSGQYRSIFENVLKSYKYWSASLDPESKQPLVFNFKTKKGEIAKKKSNAFIKCVF